MKLKQKLRDYGIDSKKHDVHGLRRAISKEFHQRKRESITRSKKIRKENTELQKLINENKKILNGIPTNAIKTKEQLRRLVKHLTKHKGVLKNQKILPQRVSVPSDNKWIVVLEIHYDYVVDDKISHSVPS